MNTRLENMYYVSHGQYVVRTQAGVSTSSLIEKPSKLKKQRVQKYLAPSVTLGAVQL